MNKRMISLMAAALALLSASGQVSFTGVGEHPVIELTPETNTGLDKIYVVYDINGVTMHFDSSTGERAQWESYYYRNGDLVIGPVAGLHWNGMSTSLENIIPNVGYKIQDGNNHPFYCWVVNYVDYPFELNDMSFGTEAPCNLLSFNLDGQAAAIDYYVSGRRHVIDRQIELKYETLEFIEDSINSKWEPVDVIETFPALDQSFEIEPPLCNTKFLLTGDRFLREWNMELEGIEIDLYTTQAVDCKAMAWQENHDGTYSKIESVISDGSAPIHVLFKGFPTDAAVYRAWQIATDPEFENIILQYNQDEVDYSFTDVATYYVRYMVANASGTCEKTSDIYTVSVGESSMGVLMEGRREVSNVFSPGTTPGINDIWKVPSKSLIEFHCWIFNRWGNLVYEFTDPNGGWDGTYKGKLVDPGVYYYVAKGLGSDGVPHEKRGDITIINYNQRYGTDPMGGNGGSGGNGGTEVVE